jgi:hypothetical protein
MRQIESLYVAEFGDVYDGPGCLDSFRGRIS